MSADAVVCTAALHCCEATERSVRSAARREGIDSRDPRYDPRRAPRYGDEYGYDDPRDDPRIRRAVSHLVQGCRQLQNPDEAHAAQCARQIESIRHAIHEAGARVPATCRVPDMPTAAPTGVSSN